MEWLQSYVVDAPQTIEECFETEVIVVNLEIGTYFSLRGAAADAWVRMAAGQSPEEIHTAWSAQFPGVESMRGDVEHYFDELLAEGLIRAGAGALSSAETPKTIPLHAYLPPDLEKYTDMQDLLLLDPVHDVDETGWPATRPV